MQCLRGTTGNQCVASLLTLALASFSAFITARGEVADIDLSRLVSASDRIVLAVVTKVEPGSKGIKSTSSPVKIATARVVETWKGSQVPEIRFVATPTEYCDISGAEKGEKLLVFLEPSVHTVMKVAHLGRGQMTIQDIEHEPYAMIAKEVKLPAGTRIVTKSEKRVLKIPRDFPSAKPSDAPPISVTICIDRRFVKLATLRDLIRQYNMGAKRKGEDVIPL